MRNGYIYIATNEVITFYGKEALGILNVCKIGSSHKNPLFSRYGRFDQNPFAPTIIEYSKYVKNPLDIEKYIAMILYGSKIKLGAGKEWYTCDLKMATSSIQKAIEISSQVEQLLPIASKQAKLSCQDKIIFQNMKITIALNLLGKSAASLLPMHWPATTNPGHEQQDKGKGSR